MTKKLLFLILLILLITQIPFAESVSTIQFTLTLDNTNNNVYIPDVGEVSSSELGAGTTYSSPTHYYLASYANNTLYGLVFYKKTAKSMRVSNTATNHSLNLNLTTANSRMFLTFTKGTWKEIDNNIVLIEAGDFLSNIAPTFGYGLGIYYVIKILAKYQDIDIQGNVSIQRGPAEIILESNRTDSQKAVIVSRSPT